MTCEPLAEKRLVKITDKKTKIDWIYVLNMAEIKLNVLIGLCLNRRIDNIDEVRSETTAWQHYQENRKSKENWQFTTDDARIKLDRLYPSIKI